MEGNNTNRCQSDENDEVVWLNINEAMTRVDITDLTKKYDTGWLNMRSKAKHDEWQKLLPCEVLCLDGADTLAENFAKVKYVLDKQTN